MRIKHLVDEESERIAGPAPPDQAVPISIPEGLGYQRPSLALDPVARMRVSKLAKWLLLIAMLCFVIWLPMRLYTPDPRQDKHLHDMVAVMASVILAGVVATGVPRTLLPGVFGRWFEAVEALRDWLVVGLVTGLLYFASIAAVNALHIGPRAADTTWYWLHYRLPLLIPCAIVGVFLARLLAIRREGLTGQSTLAMLMQAALQAALIGLMQRAFEGSLWNLTKMGGPQTAFGLASLVCLLVSVSIIGWAALADNKLIALQKRAHPGSGGVAAGKAPVELTLAMIGGAECGKTVLLTAAYYEWSLQQLGNLRITPATDTSHDAYPIGTDLERVANDLYADYKFPIGTIVCQSLPFNLTLNGEVVARFNFLDYPGGALSGKAVDEQAVLEFWRNVDNTDGVVLIADMSYVRRARKDRDWMEVRNAYMEVMHRLAKRNGRNRVVPVALVLTKCDEFKNPETGLIDKERLEQGLRDFQYRDLETEWRRLCATSNGGPGFAEFTTWVTSAITYSEPRRMGDDPEGDYDMQKPFVLAPPPPSIMPTGCASPLLWISAKVLRWNVTMFRDLSSFLFGASPRERHRIEAMLALEDIADQRAAQV